MLPPAYPPTIDMKPKKDEGRVNCFLPPPLLRRRLGLRLPDLEEAFADTDGGRCSHSAQILALLSTPLAGVLLDSRHFMNATCRTSHVPRVV